MGVLSGGTMRCFIHCHHQEVGNLRVYRKRCKIGGFDNQEYNLRCCKCTGLYYGGWGEIVFVGYKEDQDGQDLEAP